MFFERRTNVQVHHAIECLVDLQNSRSPLEEARLLRKHSHDIHGPGVAIRNSILAKYGVKLDKIFDLADGLAGDQIS